MRRPGTRRAVRADMASIRIGISGWRYPPWRGTFYPEDLAQKNELSYAASKLPIIEINGSFYSAAAAVELSAVVRADAGELHLQREGAAIHHPHAQAARGGDAARELPRIRACWD